MARSLDEKYEYNQKRKNDFSVGYTVSVELYRDFPKMNKSNQKIVRGIMTNAGELAKAGDQYGKGFMCGMRDAANERKKRKDK